MGSVSVLAAATAFDVDAATRAYLDMVQGAARERSNSYFEGGYWLLLWGTLLSVLVNWALLHFGWSARWSDWGGRRTRREWLTPALYALPYILATTLILAPWSIYTGFFRERSYGLMNLSLPGWLSEQAIALAISLVIAPLVLMAIFAVIRRAPRGWWLWGTGITVAFLTFGALVSPVFIAPLFNTYEPMAEGPLRNEILALARASAIPADDVYVFNASKQTDRISANVSGLGPTVRIALNDNLLNRTSPEEIKAVMGHEMGHYVLNHVPKRILSMSLVLLAMFFVLWWATPRLLRRHASRWKVAAPADPAALPAYAVVASVFMLLMTPVLNSITRVSEIEADRFGRDAAREPDGFARVAMRLSEYRKLEPGALEEIVFFTHPSGYNRVRASMEWKGRHLHELPPADRAIQRPPPLPPKF
jgi:STE24 endopeptidase